LAKNKKQQQQKMGNKNGSTHGLTEETKDLLMQQTGKSIR